MCNTELVVSIVLENTNTFIDIDKNECKSLIRVLNKGLISLSDNIKKKIKKYKCEYIFNTLMDNITSYVFAKERNGKTKIINNKIRKLLNTEDDLKEDLKTLIVAELKEQIFEEMFDSCFSIIDTDILRQFIKIAKKKYGNKYLLKHRHNQDNYLFEDKDYSFYHFFEKKNRNIIQEYYDGNDSNDSNDNNEDIDIY